MAEEKRREREEGVFTCQQRDGNLLYNNNNNFYNVPILGNPSSKAHQNRIGNHYQEPRTVESIYQNEGGHNTVALVE